MWAAGFRSLVIGRSHFRYLDMRLFAVFVRRLLLSRLVLARLLAGLLARLPLLSRAILLALLTTLALLLA
jgi:hypothetical protein